MVIDDSDSLFGDDPKDDAKDDESKSHTDVIDLATTDEVPKANLSSNEDRRVSFHKFSCAICMDDVTNLTITHCGMYIPPVHAAAPSCRVSRGGAHV